MTDSSTPSLDSYPEYKPLIVCMAEHSKTNTLNREIVQLALFHFIDVIGDDDLQFEIEEIYPHLSIN